MPIPLIALAIPVLHSSGAWIASTAAGGYVAGTLSSTWVGAFILGNKALVTGAGLVSGGGLLAALGGGGAAAAAGPGFIGSTLIALGLASAPAPVVATYLGLTPVGWGIAGGGALAASLALFLTRKIMRRMNEERAKGGLGPITIPQLIREVRQFEAQSMLDILRGLQGKRDDVSVSENGKEATIKGQVFSIARLKYAVNEDGSHEIVFVTKTGRKKRVLLVKAAGPAGDPAY